MSKQMDKARMAAYQRERRAKKKAQAVNPDVKPSVNPVNVNPECQSPVNPSPVIPCAECERLRAELAKERAEIARLREKIKTLEGSPAVKIALPYLPPVDRPLAPRTQGKALDKDEADALRQRVTDAKVDRVNSYAKGHVIGTARL